MDSNPVQVTELLHAFAKGDKSALDQLLPMVYEDLRLLAERRRAYWRADQAPGGTSMVHQLYVKLAAQHGAQWENRQHFFLFASTALRNMLIDHAKSIHRKKREGAGDALELKEHHAVEHSRSAELLGLDDALQKLEQMEPRLGRIVECRFFGGLTVEETAEALEISPMTVKRGWRAAQAWLYKEMNQDRP